MKHIKTKYIVGFFLLFAVFTSCSDDSSNDEGGNGGSDNQVINIQAQKEFIKLKIQYEEESFTEKMREEWTYDEKKRITAYQQLEDGSIIEKHHDFFYNKEDGLYIQKYTKSLYMIGYKIAYVTENITKTFLDSALTKIKEEIIVGKSDSTRIEYQYNEAGLEIGVVKYQNGEKSSEQKEYEYKDRSCSYTEGSYVNNKWETKKHDIVYANTYYNLISKSILYKSNSTKEDERYEYSYNATGKKTQESYYYGGKIVYTLKDFNYTKDGVTYYKEDFDNEETSKVEEVFLQ